MAVDGIGSNSVFGITAVGSARAAAELRERRDRRENAAGSATEDPRAAFDAELQSMLGEAAAVGGVSRPDTGRTESLRPENQSGPDTYHRPQAASPITYNAAGRLNQNARPTAPEAASAVPTSPAPVSSAPVGGGADTLASQPATVPAGAESTGTADAAEDSTEGKSEAVKTPGELSKAEEEQVQKLQQRDAEVRAHEQAHQATGGEHAGGASYSYQRGPDNRQYAVGGSVPIDVSPVANDPEATVQKAEKVRAAAMAPASPSGQDQQVAAKASQMAAKARAEQAEEQINPDKDDDKTGIKVKTGSDNARSGKSEAPDKSEDPGKTDTAAATDDARKAAASGITGLATGQNARQTVDQSRSAEPYDAHETADTTSATDSAGKLGVGAEAARQTAAVSGVGRPRPSEGVEAMARNRESDSARSTALSPAAQATRAAFAAMGSLDSLQQTAEAARPDAPLSRDMGRVMSRANAAYTRVRGETGLAPAGTGISLSV